MALVAAKITELPLRNAFPLTSSHSNSLRSIFTSQKPPLKRYFSSSLCTTSGNENRTSPSSSSSPWLDKWPSTNPSTDVETEERNGRMKTLSNQEVKYVGRDKGQNAIERIVLRLRNLGLGSDDEDEEEEERELGRLGSDSMTGEERLGDLLRREWVRPDSYLSDSDDEEREGDGVVLPWEKEERDSGERKEGRRRSVQAPTLAELTIEDEELRRLRRTGMFIRERINVPKAGITQAVLDKIHDKWRKEELVRLKFHEVLATDMRTAHEIVERRTGGLVIWRSGSVVVVYRGNNYEGPVSRSRSIEREGDTLFVPDVTAAEKPIVGAGNIENIVPEKSELALRNPMSSKNLTEEEVEYNNLLDGLGPRFEEWWGTGVLPVDADLLPEKVPGYKTPFRVLPTGMRSRLTNAEMTNLRKLAKSLPSHFALGRNRNHQGLAAAITKLWEKSLVVKIAVKRGIQNTNNKLMAEELKLLTGGTLLLRNKYYIVMYRGKDFLPPTVAVALSERQDLAKQIQDIEEKIRSGLLVAAPSGEDGQAQAGSLAEFYEVQARWGREVSAEEREKMIEEASRFKSIRLVKQIEHKLAIAQAKKLRAERLLSKIEASMIPVGPDDDQETITDEERTMFRRVGLKMKAYLPLGIRGVFDGVIENMHLHWKHRELVKLISKQKTLSFVEDTARLLEYESGGILVAIERVPKGYALIYYRGKNYRRPISLRPRNLLTKAKALKRSVAMQRHEALSQHIAELEQKIQQMKKEIGDFDIKQSEDNWNSEVNGYDEVSDFTESDNEAVFFSSDHDDNDVDWEDDEEFNTNDKSE